MVWEYIDVSATAKWAPIANLRRQMYTSGSKRQTCISKYILLADYADYADFMMKNWKGAVFYILGTNCKLAPALED
jgi:hypothetical protein